MFLLAPLVRASHPGSGECLGCRCGKNSGSGERDYDVTIAGVIPAILRPDVRNQVTRRTR